MSDDAPSDDEPRDDGPADAGEDGLPDDGLTPGRFREVVERLGSSVVTASQVARVLDVTQAEANDALDALADAGRVARLDVSDDPVVWFPRDLDSWADREHVVAFPDRREIVVEHPAQFTRAQLAQFAHLVDANREEGYLYRVREEDVWHAPYDSFDALRDTMRAVLGRSPQLEEWAERQWGRARKFALRTQDDYTVLEAASADLLGNVAMANGKLEQGEHVRAVISDTEAWVVEGKEGEVKRILYDAGYPVRDERDLDPGDPLDVDLRLELRDYQQGWVDRFTDSGAGVFVGPPGSGKTVAALGVMDRVGGETLVLVPSRDLAEQWETELLAHTSLAPEQIGQYHGGAKEIRPVTIATYQTAGMDRHRMLFDDRQWGLIVYDECLGGDTVIETSDGRTTFAELDDEYGFDDGWNEDVDLQVRTFDTGASEYRMTNVTGVFRAERDAQRITTNVGHTIEATPNHTHMVFDPETCTVSEQEGVEEGDFLVRPLTAPDETDEHHPDDDPLAELLGWFIGDGHMNEYGDVKFSFGARTEEQVGIIADLCDRLDVSYSTFENSRGDLTLHAPKLRETLDWDGPTGDKTSTVSVPAEAYSWEPGRIGALLRGLFDAEGSVDKKGRIEFNSVSEPLASDVVALLQRIGIPTRRIEIERDDDAHSNVHRVVISSYYGPRFEQRVGFRMDHKASRISGGESPATGLPVGPYLEQLKADASLPNEQVAELAGVNRQTIGDTIRGRYRLGQRHIHTLRESLSRRANESPDPFEERTWYSITYEEIGEEAGLPTTTAYKRFEREESDVEIATHRIMARQQTAMERHAEHLDALQNVQIVEVTDVEDGGTTTVYDFETSNHTFLADGFLTHNCHHIPASIYRRSTDLQGKHRLGLSATPIREDDKEREIFTLIGPPIGTDWAQLFDAGFVAEPQVELVYVPWADDMVANEYGNAEGYERRQVAGTNPAKLDAVRALLERHGGQKTLVFVDWLDQGRALSEALGVPFVSGETRHAERGRLFDEFREDERDVLVISRVGDEGIDLPNAEVAIVASGLGGSRRQGSQRAGRTMRPVGGALMYVLATRGTVEEDFARQQMRHLAGKGIRVDETDLGVIEAAGGGDEPEDEGDASASGDGE